ncbi:hypothetical protein FOVSG1_002565 [Fusarium oxysporum f. sp. vasinfectum]
MIGNVVSNVAAMSQGERKFAQVERAAEELGIRLAELHEFLATPEGNAFVTQLSGMAAPQQISSGYDQSKEPLSQEPSSQNNAHQEHGSQDTSSHEPSSQEQSAQQTSPVNKPIEKSSDCSLISLNPEFGTPRLLCNLK